MSGERGRRRSQSTSKTSKDEPESTSNKHPRVEIETLRLDDTMPPPSPHDVHSLEAAGRSPSFKLRMIGNYCVERTIGRGQFGKVKLAYHKKLPDMKVAIKIINKTKLDEDTLKMIQREVHIMKALQHPNIIRLYEVLETPRTFYLIMEYAEGGEVMDFIIAHGKIPEREAKRFFAQMLSAVQYCHSKKCCHRDLKPENLLLDSNMNVKIIDFGLSNMYVPGSLMKTFCGSPTYASPELILRKEYLGPPVDVWSMGVVLFVLVCGYLPFDGHNFVDLFNKILKAQYSIPSHVSTGCASLLERMLVVEPDERATIDEIRKHPWLSSVQDCLPDVQQIEITDPSRANQAILSELEMLGYDKNEAAMYYLIDSKKYQARRGSVSTNGPPMLSHSMPSPTSPLSTPPSLSPSLSVSPSLSPPPSPPHTPNTLTTSKSSKNDEPKKVGFNITTRIGERGEKEKEKEKGRSAVHRRAASEAMKEQVLKQAKAQHEALKLAQYSTPQTKPANFGQRDERDHHHTPTLQHVSTAPIRHSMAIGAYDTSNWTPPSHPADLYKSSNTNNNNNNNNNGDESVIPPPSPNSSKMASLLSSFKSMWRHKDKDKEKDKTKSGDADQPRVVRFAFHVSTMTERSPDLVVASIQNLLKEQAISFTMKGDFCANCVVDNVRFSVEVCRLPRLSVNGVRFSRISGSAWKYKTIVKDLVPLLKI